MIIPKSALTLLSKVVPEFPVTQDFADLLLNRIRSTSPYERQHLSNPFYNITLHLRVINEYSFPTNLTRILRGVVLLAIYFWLDLRRSTPPQPLLTCNLARLCTSP